MVYPGHYFNSAVQLPAYRKYIATRINLFTLRALCVRVRYPETSLTSKRVKPAGLIETGIGRGKSLFV